MSAPEKLIDWKAWCPLSFLLECYNHDGNTRQKPEERHKIKELSEKVKQRKLNIKVAGIQPMALVQNRGLLNDLWQ